MGNKIFVAMIVFQIFVMAGFMYQKQYYKSVYWSACVLANIALIFTK